MCLCVILSSVFLHFFIYFSPSQSLIHKKLILPMFNYWGEKFFLLLCRLFHWTILISFLYGSTTFNVSVLSTFLTQYLYSKKSLLKFFPKRTCQYLGYTLYPSLACAGIFTSFFFLGSNRHGFSDFKIFCLWWVTECRWSFILKCCMTGFLLKIFNLWCGRDCSAGKVENGNCCGCDHYSLTNDTYMGSPIPFLIIWTY